NTAGIHSADAGGPHFSTKGSQQQVYAVDGVTVTDNNYGSVDDGRNGAGPIYFDFETFQERQVPTRGSHSQPHNAGRAANVVTKRGTNQIRGSARYYYTSDKLQSDNTSAEAEAEGLQTDSLRFLREYGIELGGPILKDRLWIWGAAARQDFGTNTTGSDFYGNRLTQDVKLQPGNAKLNWQIIPTHSLGVSYTRSKRTELPF